MNCEFCNFVSQSRDANSVCVAFGSIKESSSGMSIPQTGRYSIVNIEGGNVCVICML